MGAKGGDDPSICGKKSEHTRNTRVFLVLSVQETLSTKPVYKLAGIPVNNDAFDRFHHCPLVVDGFELRRIAESGIE
jgi:hypothetical protein